METKVREILSLGMSEEEAQRLVEDNLEVFRAVFTTKRFDPERNYEFFELMGDLSINKFIINYMMRRFPHLKSSQGVGVLANLRIIYGSKERLAFLCEKYELDKFVRKTPADVIDKLNTASLMEDVFEALFGAIEFCIDRRYFHGMGYIFVYRILEKIFDQIDIKIDYDSLVDAKTILNELGAEHKELKKKYTETKDDMGNFVTSLYINGRLAGRGVSLIKKTSQILASEEGLLYLQRNFGIVRHVPERYSKFPNFTW